MNDLKPDAPAWRDEDDDRPGVVEPKYVAILNYVYSPDGNCILHLQESAKAFAGWAFQVWTEFHDGEDETTNRDIIDGMLIDWRGDKGGPE